MTSKQASYQLSNEFDYRAMLEDYSIAQLEEQIRQHELELQGNSEMAEFAGPYDAPSSDYEQECEEIKAYLAIDREVLASKQAVKEASEQPAEKWTIEASAPIDIMELANKQADDLMASLQPAKKAVKKPAKKARKASAKKVIVESGDSLASYEEKPAASYEEIETEPSMDAPDAQDIIDEIEGMLALRNEQEMAAMHAENPLEAPTAEEIDAMAQALSPSIDEQASEERITGKLAAIEEPAAPEVKQATSPKIYIKDALKKLASNQKFHEGPCQLGIAQIPAGQAVLESSYEKGRTRYTLLGKRSDGEQDAYYSYGDIGGFWYATDFASLAKWIGIKAGLEPTPPQPNIPAAKLGLVTPKPEKQAASKKVILPAGDKGLKMADQRAMQAELNLLRHVNEINSFISFGILPELSLEDGQAFKVMQAFLDGSAIWLFGFNDGELASKDPYYAIEASDAHLDALCELFQIKRAK